MIHTTKHAIGDGMVAILLENNEVDWPYLVQNYAIEVDGWFICDWDRSMGGAISDTYDRATHIWRGILLKTKEIQSVQPS